MEESHPTSRETVRVLAALSDENRFRIVELLAAEDQELSCGAIGKALDISPSLLSHHLSILADAGLIARRKNGLWTMNGLQRPVLRRQVAALESMLQNGDAPPVPATGPHGAAPGSIDDAMDATELAPPDAPA